MKERIRELVELCKKYNIEFTVNNYGIILRKFENDQMFNRMHSIELLEHLHDSISMEDIVIDFINEWEENK